jgi:hypothetical protein
MSVKHIYTFLILLICSCNNGLPVNQYINWFKVSNDNLNIGQTDNYEFELRYISPKALALMEFDGNIDSLNKYINEYNMFSNFTLKIFSKEREKDVLRYLTKNESEYYERLQYFISYLNYDIKAINSQNDTIQCVFHHYERTYNITPYANITISFESDIKEIKKIIIKLPFDNNTAEMKIENKTYPELKL